ncbi:hypothetical protein ACP3TC_07450 [Winslowiella sp. 2C04]|uniref:hypothetical protein n=1 Tax=Winslowiella sp. 2C04 TaxID=3416179 RepID=UPI003CF79D1B
MDNSTKAAPINKLITKSAVRRTVRAEANTSFSTGELKVMAETGLASAADVTQLAVLVLTMLETSPAKGGYCG